MNEQTFETFDQFVDTIVDFSNYFNETDNDPNDMELFSINHQDFLSSDSNSSPVRQKLPIKGILKPDFYFPRISVTSKKVSIDENPSVKIIDYEVDRKKYRWRDPYFYIKYGNGDAQIDANDEINDIELIILLKNEEEQSIKYRGKDHRPDSILNEINLESPISIEISDLINSINSTYRFSSLDDDPQILMVERVRYLSDLRSCIKRLQALPNSI